MTLFHHASGALNSNYAEWKKSEYPKKSSQWEKFYSQKITITWVHLHLD